MTGHPTRRTSSFRHGRPHGCAGRSWLALLACLALSTGAAAAVRLPDASVPAGTGASSRTVPVLADEPADDGLTTSALTRHRHVRLSARIRVRLARQRALRAIARREREIEIWRREFGDYGLRRQIATEREL